MTAVRASRDRGAGCAVAAQAASAGHRRGPRRLRPV